MKRALGLAMVLLLVGAGLVAADAFPLPGHVMATSGDGWRVLAEFRSGDADYAFVVEVATDRDDWHALWGRVSGLRDFAPHVNLDGEIVALFGVGINDCVPRTSFDDVVFDQPRRLVHAAISETRTCPFYDLTGANIYVVALARNRLPPSPFTLQLREEPVCGSCADPPDSIVVDL